MRSQLEDLPPRPPGLRVALAGRLAEACGLGWRVIAVGTMAGRAALAGMVLLVALAGCDEGAGGLEADADAGWRLSDATLLGTSDAVSPDASAPDVRDDAGEPDAGPSPPINAGFVGGACVIDADCAFEGGWCMQEEAGLPGGHCTRPCDLYCPDREGAVTTLCVDPAALGFDDPAGACVARCDFGVSPTGCRQGYQCVEMPRFGQSDAGFYACLPGDDAPFQLSACHQALLDRGVGFEPAVAPEDHPDGYPGLPCDVVDPVRVDGVMEGVAYRYATEDASAKRLFAACPLALALHDTAALVADQGVTDILHLGVYSCRTIAGTSTLSQHAHANALDIGGVRLASGAVYDVLDDWEPGAAFPVTDAGSFLRWLASTLYEDAVFHIVLTPEYNGAHADHLHLDLTPGGDFLR